MEPRSFPSDREAVRDILEAGRRMYEKGFVAANDGNLSCRVSDNVLWTTPTGVSKGYMTPDMLVKVDLDGHVLEGSRVPSSELKLHLRVYRENPAVTAVVHAHPPVATAFAIAGIPLDRPVLPEAVIQLGEVPIAPYATPGTQGVPDAVAPFCSTHNAVLLANHGALTWGGSILQAWYRMESVEYYATILLLTDRVLGQANELSEPQLDALLATRAALGIRGGGRPGRRLGTS